MDLLGPEVASFRASSKALLPLCVFPAIVTLPLVVRKLALAEELSLIAVGVGIVIVPASVLLMYALLWPLLFVFVVRVHELGIRGHDMYGRRLSVTWPHVGSIASASLVGVTWLRIATSDPKRVLWLPHFLARQDEFDALVARYAGDAHPLTRRLRGGA